MQLKDISTITTGLVTTRKKASMKFEVEEIYKLLTLNAVEDYGTIDRDELSKFESVEKLKDQYFTQEGDILVRLNEPFTSIYINKENEGILIPSYFVKLRVTNKKFKAEYVAWYLNSEKVKRDFLRSQSGTLVASINQKVIYEIDIWAKTIKEQEDIVNLYRLYIREIELMKKLMEEREKQFNGITEKLIRKASIHSLKGSFS